MPQAQKDDEVIISLHEQQWALPLTDGVGVWGSQDCGMPGRELLLIDEAQLAAYRLELANSPLVWDAVVQVIESILFHKLF